MTRSFSQGSGENTYARQPASLSRVACWSGVAFLIASFCVLGSDSINVAVMMIIIKPFARAVPVTLAALCCG